MKNRVLILLELSKFRITLFSTLTTATGYFLATSHVGFQVLVISAGVWLLACGAAVLNQYQERGRDALMARTRTRPLPSGRISPPASLILAFSFLLAGALLLLLEDTFTAFFLGLSAVLWYNGLYTYLKSKTAFAVFPGALIGAIPPAIGWSAAGGSLQNPKIIMLSFFFFVWQIPHFWILLLRYGKEYEQAGFPSPTTIFTPAQLQRLTFIWILAAAVTCLLLPLVSHLYQPLLYIVFLLATFWMIATALRLLRFSSNQRSAGTLFRGINLYALIVVMTLAIDKILK